MSDWHLEWDRINARSARARMDDIIARMVDCELPSEPQPFEVKMPEDSVLPAEFPLIGRSRRGHVSPTPVDGNADAKGY